MKKEINLTVRKVDFKDKENVPAAAKEKVFVPCWGEDFNHHYYLNDFETGETTSFQVSLKEALAPYAALILNLHNTYENPYNMTYDQFLFWITCPHQGEFFDGKIIVSLNYCPFFVSIEIATSKAYLIHDETAAIDKVYASTNQIVDGVMYTCRWGIENTYNKEKSATEGVPLEILSYNLEEDTFNSIALINGKDQIHSTSLTPDGKFLIMIEQNATPKIAHEAEKASEEELQEMVKAGLVDSKCIIYNLATGSYKKHTISGSPAHVEYDKFNPALLYFSQHQLGINKGQLYSFDSAKILKYKVTEDCSLIDEEIFDFEKAVRLPGHVAFEYKNKNYIVAPSTPNQIILIDRDTMELSDNIVLSKSSRTINFGKEPYLHVPMSIDKTPYSVQAKSGESYLYLSNSTTLGLFSMEENKRLFNFRYNTPDMVLGGGHSTRFDRMTSGILT